LAVTTEPTERLTFRQRCILAVVPRLVWALLSLAGRTWRFETITEEGATPVPRGVGICHDIYCFWHQCVLLCTFYFRNCGATIIVSQSFDGELIARTLHLFGYKTVRGSSSRGAGEALLGLRRVVDQDGTAIFTADGPRGPIYRTKAGPIKLAALTGVPIGAFHLEPRSAWTLRSWDHFFVPRPFTRVAVSWSRLTHVPTDLTENHFEQKREELNAAIERARHHALAYFGKAATNA
jgi:lysophospholipid acyltransferase (LPLAT)-like uncharacterized protein